MTEQGKARSPDPRGPFDHPRLANLRAGEVDRGPGWDDSSPDGGERGAGRAEATPPRGAEDAERDSLVERATRRAGGQAG